MTVPATTSLLVERPTGRLVGPDVARAIALVGVVVMNYHGYLNGGAAVAVPGASLPQRLFDPWTGVLATRFAATFVTVAGVGVTLLTNRSRSSGDPAAISDERWRLVRRGFVLYAGGFVLDWIWPGTIIFYYGAMFMIAALLFTLRTRWIVLAGAGAAVAATAIQWWAVERELAGHSTAWLFSPATLTSESPRGLVLDTFVNGTHPVLPWLAFLCAGIVLGRAIDKVPLVPLAAAGALVTAATYLAGHVLLDGQPAGGVRATLSSTRPYDRGLLYTAGAIGSSVCAISLVSWIAERARGTRVVQVLQVAGQATLTLYVAHVLVFDLLVDRLRWVRPTGLDTALVFAGVFWLAAIGAAAAWRRVAARGPLEVLYRRFGD